MCRAWSGPWEGLRVQMFSKELGMGDQLARFRDSERVTKQLLRGLHFDGGFVGKKSIKGEGVAPLGT